MKGVVVVLGLLLLLGGGAVAAAQYVPLDLASLGGAQDFLKSQNALYAGGGAAALGLILFVVGLLLGKKSGSAGSPKMTKPMPVEPTPATKAPEDASSPLRPVDRPPPAPVEAAKPAPEANAPPAPQPEPTPVATPETPKSPPQDLRLLTRKRISDLVTINDALKAFHAKMGAYPVAEGLQGEPDRGENWVPGLVPEFLPDLPSDPAGAGDNSGPQYFYMSDGAGYKLIAHGVSADGSNVEVLGVKIDPARSNESGFWAYGFWTEGFDKF
ncbi:MAG: hypothetical protein R3C46_09615 [Hyphomonadaceae bacterium]